MLKAAQNVTPIYAMQDAILKFKAEAQKHPVFSMNPEDFGGKAKKSLTPTTKGFTTSITGPGGESATKPQIQGEPDNLGGYSHFSQYLMDNYINNQQYGKQFLPVDLQEEQRMGVGAGKLNNLSSLIDSIGRVGGAGKGEKFVDGVWGPRTNNSLKLIYNILRTVILVVTQDFGMKIEYDLNWIEGLKNLIPTDEVPYKSKNIVVLQKLATQINEEYLKPSVYIINQFNENILKNKNVENVISQKSGILPLGKKPVHPSEDKNLSGIFEKSKLSTFNAKLGDKDVTFTYDDLSSLEKFKAALSKVDPVWARDEYIQQAYNAVRKSSLG